MKLVYREKPATRYEIFIIKLEIYYARNSRAKPAISFSSSTSCAVLSSRERRVVIYFFLRPL